MDIADWSDTYKSIAKASHSHIATVKRLVRDGDYPAVKFGSPLRPQVRLMPWPDYLALKGRVTGLPADPEPIAAPSADPEPASAE